MATAAARKRTLRIRRHARVRKHVAGTPARPRLAVFRSGRHISAQVIDDTAGRTAGRGEHGGGRRCAAPPGATWPRPRRSGKLVADRAKSAGVTQVVFDRGGFRYHGRVAALADAAREGGLEF